MRLKRAAGARFCASTAYYGIRTHNAIKALHLDELFGSKVGRWTPGAKIEKSACALTRRAEIWDGHNKLGQAVAYEAMDTCMKLADKFGIGMVSVDNATHYLWGGGYVMDAAAQRLYRLYQLHVGDLRKLCRSAAASPTMGTNPHSWAFPDSRRRSVFPIVIDWATSTVAMGRVQQFKLSEGKQLPPEMRGGWRGQSDDRPE